MVDQTVTATDARVHFGELMRRVVEQQQAIVVERAGKPQVVLLSIAEYERLKAHDGTQPDWRALINESRSKIQAELGNRTLTPPEEIIRELREERSAQLANLR